MGLAYSGGVFQVISLKSDPSRRLLWALTGLGTCVADARHQHLSGLGLLPGCGEKSSSALPRLRVCQGSPEKHSKRMRVCKYYEVCFKESAHTITEAAGSQSCTGAGRLRTRGGPDVAVQIRRYSCWQHALCFRGSQPLALFTPSTDWTWPTPVMEGNLLDFELIQMLISS